MRIYPEKRSRFYCVHCGERFDLPTDEMILYSEGWLANEPDCCEECRDMINHPAHDIMDLHSDADSGL